MTKLPSLAPLQDDKLETSGAASEKKYVYTDLQCFMS